MSRVSEQAPISFLYPSNIAAPVFEKMDECMTDFATQLFTHAAGNFSPVRWDMEESFAEGHLTEAGVNFLRAAAFTMALSFPALGISGAPRLIGFTGDRAHLDDVETEHLNFLMIHLHARLTVVGRGQTVRRDPLSDLERKILALAADGESFGTISGRISLSNRAVQYLVDSICRKMEVATLEHAVAIALRRKVIV